MARSKQPKIIRVNFKIVEGESELYDHLSALNPSVRARRLRALATIGYAVSLHGLAALIGVGEQPGAATSHKPPAGPPALAIGVATAPPRKEPPISGLYKSLGKPRATD